MSREIRRYFLLTKRIEEHFDLLQIVKTILRGLSKAKFDSVESITLDGRVMCKDTRDINTCIGLLDGMEERFSEGKNIKLVVKAGKIICKVDIRKIHLRKDSTIRIRIINKIRKEYVHRFLNHIKSNLPIEDLRMSGI